MWGKSANYVGIRFSANHVIYFLATTPSTLCVCRKKYVKFEVVLIVQMKQHLDSTRSQLLSKLQARIQALEQPNASVSPKQTTKLPSLGLPLEIPFFGDVESETEEKVSTPRCFSTLLSRGMPLFVLASYKSSKIR